MTKPPVPANFFDDWPCIPVDTSEGGDFDDLLGFGTVVADHWTFGPDGPYSKPQTSAATTRMQIREALLYLLEMGFIDIDHERLHAHAQIPLKRPKPA